MIEGQPSRTALMVAVMRAHHDLTTVHPKILNDHLALPLTGLTSEQLIATQAAQIAQFASLSDQETADLFVKRISHSVCMRSRLVEGELFEPRHKPFEQLVILGAGLDSTAYRFHKELANMDVYEVDYPSTQIWKQDKLAASKIDVPNNVKFVTFDFEAQTLSQALTAGGVSKDKVTLFPWLGVQPYLTDETVRATFKTMCEFAPGSEVVMDFVAPSYKVGDSINANGLDQLQQVVSQLGEPFKSRYTAKELKTVMLDCGFSNARIHSSGELVDRFLAGDRSRYAMPESVETLASSIV